MPRSNSSVDCPIRQPSPRAPTIMSLGVRAPVKKTSLKSSAPAMLRIGRSSTPGVSSGSSRIDSPACFGASGSVRAST